MVWRASKVACIKGGALSETGCSAQEGRGGQVRVAEVVRWWYQETFVAPALRVNNAGGEQDKLSSLRTSWSLNGGRGVAAALAAGLIKQ